MAKPLSTLDDFLLVLQSAEIMADLIPTLSEELAAFALESLLKDWSRVQATAAQDRPPIWLDGVMTAQRWNALEQAIDEAVHEARNTWPATFADPAALKRTLKVLTTGAALSAVRSPLHWDHPSMRVASDPALRARYRRLQSWYREQVLGAPYGYSTDARRRGPVFSMLSTAAVADDPSLNFFGDPEILAYVEERVPQVKAKDGTLDLHRLSHNMLSSMPMAFSLVGVLRRAHDRLEIINRLFGLEASEIIGIDAEWAPDPMTHLYDRTAFDIVVHYRTAEGRRGVLGIETKYTEPLSPTKYDSDRYREITEASGIFVDRAADALLGASTNQLWRNTLLAVSMPMIGEADEAHVAVVGLRDDASLWKSVDLLHSQMKLPSFVIPIPWEELISRLDGTSLWSFGALFSERYLDTSPIDTASEGQPLVCRPRRSIATGAVSRRWHFADWTGDPRPGRDATGDEPDWGRWVPTVWRAVNDVTRTITLPPRPPSDHIDSAAWWSPLLHLALYSFAWPDPATALDNWDRAGRPLDDPRFSLIDAIWGRHLDVMLHHLWTNRPTFLPEGRDLGWSPIRKRPDVPTAVARHELRASWSGPNPSSGGSDSLHLSGHVYSPFVEGRASRENAQLVEGDLGVAGPPRATLILDRYDGWYRTLHELGATLPGNTALQAWRVDVVVSPIGRLGTYRLSRETGRWFAGRHRHHVM